MIPIQKYGVPARPRRSHRDHFPPARGRARPRASGVHDSAAPAPRRQPTWRATLQTTRTPLLVADDSRVAAHARGGMPRMLGHRASMPSAGGVADSSTEAAPGHRGGRITLDGATKTRVTTPGDATEAAETASTNSSTPALASERRVGNRDGALQPPSHSSSCGACDGPSRETARGGSAERPCLVGTVTRSALPVYATRSREHVARRRAGMLRLARRYLREPGCCSAGVVGAALALGFAVLPCAPQRFRPIHPYTRRADRGDIPVVTSSRWSGTFPRSSSADCSVLAP